MWRRMLDAKSNTKWQTTQNQPNRNRELDSRQRKEDAKPQEVPKHVA